MEPAAGEEEPPAEPPDQGQDQLADHGAELGRRQTRSILRKQIHQVPSLVIISILQISQP